MGEYDVIVRLLTGLCHKRPDQAVCMVYYALGYYSKLAARDPADKTAAVTYYEQAMKTSLGRTFPFRHSELLILTDVLSVREDPGAAYLLGCLYYSRLHYERAASLWRQAGDTCQVCRNLAVAYFSHLDRPEEALVLMKHALDMKPDDEEL